MKRREKENKKSMPFPHLQFLYLLLLHLLENWEGLQLHPLLVMFLLQSLLLPKELNSLLGPKLEQPPLLLKQSLLLVSQLELRLQQ